MKLFVKFLIGVAVIFVICLIGTFVQVRVFTTPTHGKIIGEYKSPQKALLVIDIQEDFTGKTARPPFPYPDSDTFVEKVNDIIDNASKENMIIAYIGQEFRNNILEKRISRGNAIEGQAGTKLDSRLKILSDNYFPKRRSDAFSNSDLSDFLIKNQVNELFIVGLDATACVYKTSLGALNRHYKVTVIRDGITTFGEKDLLEMLDEYKKNGIESVQNIQTSQDALKENTELFVEIENAHGIVFDNQGNMFIGKKGMEILKVTPDAEISTFATLESLDDKTEKTHIWNMALGKDNNLYAAANDRIIRITTNGKIQNLINEDYTGEWGACDVKFDAYGNMYVAHGVKVEKYDISLKKTTIIDGQKDDIRLSSAVGIGFDKDYKNLYVGDVFNNKVVRYPLNDGIVAGTSLVIRGLSSPEYIAVDNNGYAYVSLPGGGGLAELSPDGTVKPLNCENKLEEPTTIAFGKKGFDEDSIYAVSKGKIFRVLVGSK